MKRLNQKVCEVILSSWKNKYRGFYYDEVKSIVWLFALAVCLSQISFAQETHVTAEGARGYLVGPGDVVEGKSFRRKRF